MSPFKQFLSPKFPFVGTRDLDRRFHQSKEAIILAIRKGVEIFDVAKRTCLKTDWSCQDIGYFLSQKHCSCEAQLPGCCGNGRKVTLAGPRFLHGAEKRYAVVKGEALAVAWGLEQTKYFTQGCDNLFIVTDHKPLVKLLGDRTLDEITNTRLFRLKQHTLPWRYTIRHIPGKDNKAADAMSRYPTSVYAEVVSLQLISPLDRAEQVLNASIAHEAQSDSHIMEGNIF